METLTAFIGDLSGIEINLWDFLDPPFAATVNGYAYTIASFNFGPKIIPLALRLYIIVLPKMIRHLIPRWRDESLPAYRAAIEQWKQIDLANASDEILLRGVRELAAEDAIYWFAAAVPLGLARITGAALNRFLHRYFIANFTGRCPGATHPKCAGAARNVGGLRSRPGKRP